MKKGEKNKMSRTEELLKSSGLDYRVGVVPVSTFKKTSGGKKAFRDIDPEGLDAKSVCYREDNNKMLSFVSSAFSPIQNSTMFSTLAPIVDKHRGEVSVHSVRGGKKHYMLFKGEEKGGVKVEEGDVLGVGVKVSWSHSGGSSVGTTPVVIRLLCENGVTSERVQSKPSFVSVKGYDGFEEFQQALRTNIKRVLTNTQSSIQEDAEEFKEWIKTPVPLPQVSKAVTEVFRINPIKEALKDTHLTPLEREKLFNVLEKRQTASQRWMERFKVAEGLEPNLWYLYNAFTNHFTHGTKLVKAESSEVRLLDKASVRRGLRVSFSVCQSLFREQLKA